jgi:hypothetical protein
VLGIFILLAGGVVVWLLRSNPKSKQQQPQPIVDHSNTFQVRFASIFSKTLKLFFSSLSVGTCVCKRDD